MSAAQRLASERSLPESHEQGPFILIWHVVCFGTCGLKYKKHVSQKRKEPARPHWVFSGLNTRVHSISLPLKPLEFKASCRCLPHVPETSLGIFSALHPVYACSSTRSSGFKCCSACLKGFLLGSGFAGASLASTRPSFSGAEIEVPNHSR